MSAENLNTPGIAVCFILIGLCCVFLCGCTGNSDISGTYVLAEHNTRGCRIQRIKNGYRGVWMTYEDGAVIERSDEFEVARISSWFRLPEVDDTDRYYEVKETETGLTGVCRDRKKQSVISVWFIEIKD